MLSTTFILFWTQKFIWRLWFCKTIRKPWIISIKEKNQTQLTKQTNKKNLTRIYKTVFQSGKKLENMRNFRKIWGLENWKSHAKSLRISALQVPQSQSTVKEMPAGLQEASKLQNRHYSGFPSPEAHWEGQQLVL